MSHYFHLTKTESFFLSIIIALNYKGDSVDLNDLVDYTECNPMKILEFSSDFESLYKKGYIEKKKSLYLLLVTNED